MKNKRMLVFTLFQLLFSITIYAQVKPGEGKTTEVYNDQQIAISVVFNKLENDPDKTWRYGIWYDCSIIVNIKKENKKCIFPERFFPDNNEGEIRSPLFIDTSFFEGKAILKKDFNNDGNEDYAFIWDENCQSKDKTIHIISKYKNEYINIFTYPFFSYGASDDDEIFKNMKFINEKGNMKIIVTYQFGKIRTRDIPLDTKTGVYIY